MLFKGTKKEAQKKGPRLLGALSICIENLFQLITRVLSQY